MLVQCLPTNLPSPENDFDKEDFTEDEPFVEADIVIGSQTIPLVDFKVKEKNLNLII